MSIRKVSAVILALGLLFSMCALATNHTLAAFTVTEASPRYVASAAKSDSEQRWYITLTRLTITEDDELYFNVRDADNGSRLSKAVRYTGSSTVAARSTQYTTRVSSGQTIYLHTQLGSTNWTPDSFAIASGRWCP